MVQITSDNIGILFDDGGQLRISVSSVLCGLIFLQAVALAFAGWYISHQRKKYSGLKLEYQSTDRAKSRAEDRSVSLQEQMRKDEQARVLNTVTYRLADGPFTDTKLTLDNRVVSVQLLLETSPYRRTVCQYSIAERNSLDPNERYTKPTLTLDCIALEVLRVTNEDLEDEEEAN